MESEASVSPAARYGTPIHKSVGIITHLVFCSHDEAWQKPLKLNDLIFRHSHKAFECSMKRALKVVRALTAFLVALTSR